MITSLANKALTQQFRLNEIPPTLNKIIELVKKESNRGRKNRGYWSAYGDAKHYWKNEVCVSTRDLIPYVNPDQKVWVHLEFLLKDKRSDLDNIIASQKFILDGMVESGIIKSDSMAWIMDLTHNHKVGQDYGVIVTISNRPIFELVKCV